ncbi:MAG: histidine phosphatase family protein [Bacteroidales bacterium]|jgi:phosphohistidine phosphatase|nr:histidine phosphatase family protein [Bacteroidales bacterium]MCK9497870.1 histidine phosphatase family protein [Bacteroidales bacterium]MDY0315580.1 histidine phosphatase family protein [Bacteroidales bacterium]NLB85810.1 histidine phosphatase family protein [Bacteroidales bacterium]
MKLLTLIRHAKSEQDTSDSDFDRILTERGIDDAYKIGEYLAKHLPKPDLIISSPAERAAHTAEIIAEQIDYPEDEIEFVDEIYLCSTSEFIEVLMEQNVKTKHVFLIAHNPGITSFANLLTSSNIDNMPTSSVAHIELDFYKWDDIEAETGKILKFFTPKTI